jgi:hypothetical protein
MEAGDRIRVITRYGTEDHTVEEFRFCLGVFLSDAHRQAGDFTPLCELYEPGPESEERYISNYGSYHTNQVPAWADIPRP